VGGLGGWLGRLMGPWVGDQWVCGRVGSSERKYSAFF